MSEAHQRLKVVRVDSEKNRETGLVSSVVVFQRVQEVRVRFKDSSQLQHKSFYEANIGNDVYVQLREGVLDNGRPWFNFFNDGDPFTRSAAVAPILSVVDTDTGEMLADSTGIDYKSKSPSWISGSKSKTL